MGTVDLEKAAVERLARILAPRLAEGTVRVPLAEVHDVERWRKAARRAGRLLGHGVTTGVTEDSVWACLRGPLARGEQAAAAEVVAGLIFRADHHLRPI
jgi:hypothetical protein